jgi:hypothetical protein
MLLSLLEVRDFMNAISQRMDKREKMELKIKIVKLKRYE